jgi:hypothetical protein
MVASAYWPICICFCPAQTLFNWLRREPGAVPEGTDLAAQLLFCTHTFCTIPIASREGNMGSTSIDKYDTFIIHHQ